MTINRREFLRRTIHSALGGVALYSALGNLKLVSAATHAINGGVFNDYKALVCVFLNGGNDSYNTVVPYDATHYGIYHATRPALALSQSAIAAQSLIAQSTQPGLPGGPPSDAGSYGLHPAMPELRSMFNAQQASIIGNVGTLLGPITQAQYQAGGFPTPPQLFSHDDQANFWQTSRSENWGA